MQKRILFFVLALLSLISSFTYSQQSLTRVDDLQINGLSFAAYEGIIDVPENYEAEHSKRIQLPVFLIKSSAPHSAEPVFWLDGGPGGSNIISRSKINLQSAANTLQTHDFVCVGYRGVDGSVKLESKKITKAFKGLNNHLLSEKSLHNIKEKIKSYNLELKERSIDINQYTIPNVIEDLETARKQLGYKNINLLSVSYGTRVALLYSYKHPGIIHRSMMIGACPPGYFLARPEQAEEVLDIYDQLYQNHDTTAQKLSIKALMKKAFENLPNRWSIFRLDADKIKAGTVNALYTVNFAVSVFDAYKQAAQNGDYSGLFMLQKLSDVSHPKLIGDVYAKTVSADWKNEVDYETAWRNTHTLLGANVSLIYAATAKAWDIKAIPAAYQKCQPSHTETLIISGSLDHRTPPSIVEKELMPTLSNASHVVVKNHAHVDILSTVMKHPTLLKEFFDEGKLGKNDVSGSETIDFVPKIRMSKAKIFLFGLVK